MPRVFNFNVDDEVEIVDSTGVMKSYIGKKGVISEQLEVSQYDYKVKFNNGSDIKFKESELRKLNEYEPQKEDFVRIISTGEQGFVEMVDHENRQVEICFGGYWHVFSWDNVELVSRDSDRKSWDQYFMDIADTVATRATCDRLHVGCVIVKDKKIVSTGYNGSISKHEQCNEVGHLYNEQGRCIRTIHAEQNALLFADRDELKGATAYVTHCPCENCAKLLVQSGIVRVVYKNTYENKFSKYFLDMIESVHLKEVE